jgi:hypothetical protein
MWSILEKKSEAKNLMLLSLYGKFLVSIETDYSKNIFGCFFKPSELRKSDKKVEELAGDCGELRNRGSQIL